MPVQDFHLHSSLASLASSAFVLVNQNFEGNRPTRSPLVKPSFEDSFALGEPVCQEQVKKKKKKLAISIPQGVKMNQE